MEPKEASCGLHTQEVHGSSPCAPTIPTIDSKRLHLVPIPPVPAKLPQLCQNCVITLQFGRTVPEPVSFALRFILASASRFICNFI
jgi:hypothetical protein